MKTDIKHFFYQLKDGTNIHGVKMGSGEVIIFLLHGLLNNWECWQDLALMDQDNLFTFVALDLPGYGYSDRLEKYSFEVLAKYTIEVIREFLKQNNIDSNQPVLVGGLSMGSLLTSCILEMNDSSISHYVFISPIFPNDGIKSLSVKAVGQLMKLSRKNTIILNLYKKLTYSRLMSYSLGLFTYHNFDLSLINRYGVQAKKFIDIKAYTDLGEQIPQINILDHLQNNNKIGKTMLLFGASDPYVNVKKVTNGSFLPHKLKEQLFIRVVNQAGHQVSYEHPKGTYEAIREFILK